MRAYYRANAEKIRAGVRTKYVPGSDKRKWRPRDEEKRLARSLARSLPDGVCEICGEPGEKHHDNYSKPLEVRYLCTRHHAEHHRRIP
jgi:hypothetical protein